MINRITGSVYTQAVDECKGSNFKVKQSKFLSKSPEFGLLYPEDEDKMPF